MESKILSKWREKSKELIRKKKINQPLDLKKRVYSLKNEFILTAL
jgi:hypothetical protein